MINMNGGLTGVLFAGKGGKKVPATINTVHARDLLAHPERRFTKKPIKTVIHPAGFDVVNRVNATTSADVVFEWGYKPDGNTSASASTTVFIRKSKGLKKGDDLLFASMGAGSMNGAFRVKVGKGILLNPS
jgi:hypothetical protein